jgi:endonuclease-3
MKHKYSSEAFGQKKKRAHEIVQLLRKAYPDAKCALDHSNPLELLVATMLSAQCTDKLVNIVTKDLFKKYRTAQDFAKVSQGELEKDIHSLGFFRNKAKAIRTACQRICEAYGAKVPDTMEDLLTLHGVARKTANIVLGVAYGEACGFVVDTHVRRLAWRMGLTNQEDPEKIERDLMALLPQSQWMPAGDALIFHGRQVCHARNPQHDICVVNRLCPKRGTDAEEKA